MEKQVETNFIKPEINPNFEHMFQKKEDQIENLNSHLNEKKDNYRSEKDISDVSEKENVKENVKKESFLESARKKSKEQEEKILSNNSSQDSQQIDAEEKKKVIDWKAKAEKESQRLRETQKWANETKMQISSYRKAVEKLLEERILDEEDVNLLLSYTESKEMPLEALSEREKASKIFSHELENIRKYGNYENLDEHVKALDHLVDNSTPEEIQELFAEAKELAEDDPVLFTKKILEVAERYYDEIYEDFSKAGNLKNLKASFEEEVTKRDKIIDKLEKEILKLKKRYEDYDDNPQYRIPQGGGNNVGGRSSSPMNIMKDPGGFMEEHHKRRVKY